MIRFGLFCNLSKFVLSTCSVQQYRAKIKNKKDSLINCIQVIEEYKRCMEKEKNR